MNTGTGRGVGISHLGLSNSTFSDPHPEWVEDSVIFFGDQLGIFIDDYLKNSEMDREWIYDSVPIPNPPPPRSLIPTLSHSETPCPVGVGWRLKKKFRWRPWQAWGLDKGGWFGDGNSGIQTHLAPLPTLKRSV